MVLGSGPAGLMAIEAISRAVRERGAYKTVMAVTALGDKSPLYGAQYLHKPIPGITEDAGRMIRYALQGTIDGYRRKVYGATWDGTVSPEDLEETHRGWDLRAAYDRLWDLHSDMINPGRVDAAWVRQVIYDEWYVINTIPLQALCYQQHGFQAREIIAAGDAPELGIKVPYYCPADNVMLNGLDEPAWYRMSSIFGHTTVEWPSEVSPPVPTAAKVLKPLRHKCDCWPPDRFIGVGRYGSWRKGVLTHHAYEEVLAWARKAL